VQFRSDVASLFDPDVLRACVVPGRYELPMSPGVTYAGSVDVSGGSADSSTCAVARAQGEAVVLDAVREWRPRFDPDQVRAECAAFLKSFGLSTVTGDRYGAAGVTSRFLTHGIAYEASPQTKSDLYVSSLPLINAGHAQLLDAPRSLAQLAALERRTGRGTNRDVVDHPPGGHDDVANSVAGVLVGLASGGSAADAGATLAGLLAASAGLERVSPWRLAGVSGSRG
jgi:hypothetical protein